VEGARYLDNFLEPAFFVGNDAVLYALKGVLNNRGKTSYLAFVKGNLFLVVGKACNGRCPRGGSADETLLGIAQRFFNRDFPLGYFYLVVLRKLNYAGPGNSRQYCVAQSGRYQLS